MTLLYFVTPTIILIGQAAFALLFMIPAFRIERARRAQIARSAGVVQRHDAPPRTLLTTCAGIPSGIAKEAT